jgi:hypothetical protein
VSTVVHASGCAPLLLYILLYGLDTYASRQLGQTPGIHVRSAGVGLFVPKSSTDANCQRRSIPGLGQTVRGCPLASTAVRGDCHSLCHSAVREPVVSGCCPQTLSSLRARVWRRSWRSATSATHPHRCAPNGSERRRMRLRMRLGPVDPVLFDGDHDGNDGRQGDRCEGPQDQRESALLSRQPRGVRG